MHSISLDYLNYDKMLRTLETAIKSLGFPLQYVFCSIIG